MKTHGKQHLSQCPVENQVDPLFFVFLRVQVGGCCHRSKCVPEWPWSDFSKNRVFNVIESSYLRFRFSIHCHQVFVPQVKIFIQETLKLIYWLRTNVTGTSKVKVFSATLK